MVKRALKEYAKSELDGKDRIKNWLRTSSALSSGTVDAVCRWLYNVSVYIVSAHCCALMMIFSRSWLIKIYRTNPNENIQTFIDFTRRHSFVGFLFTSHSPGWGTG